VIVRRFFSRHHVSHAIRHDAVTGYRATASMAEALHRDKKIMRPLRAVAD
jgi:hypothetical protein